MPKITTDMVEDLTTFHKMDTEGLARTQRVNAATAILLKTILDEVPDCKDRDHAIEQVRDARMWANVAISLKGAV